VITQITLNKMSKGSKRRPEKGTQYQDNWEKIFGNKNSEEKKCKTMKRSMKKQR